MKFFKPKYTYYVSVMKGSYGIGKSKPIKSFDEAFELFTKQKHRGAILSRVNNKRRKHEKPYDVITADRDMGSLLVAGLIAYNKKKQKFELTDKYYHELTEHINKIMEAEESDTSNTDESKSKIKILELNKFVKKQIIKDLEEYYGKIKDMVYYMDYIKVIFEDGSVGRLVPDKYQGQDTVKFVPDDEEYKEDVENDEW